MARWGDTRHTRRAVLGIGAAATAGALVPIGRATTRSSSAPVAPLAHSFLSRPDLAPPAVELLTVDRNAGAGLILTAPFGLPGTPAADLASGALILDGAGAPVWFRPVTGANAMDLRVQTFRGRRVLTWWEGQVFGGYGGNWLIADATYGIVGRVRAGNGFKGDLHDLWLTERGTALITIYNEVKADLTSIGGAVDGRLVEGVIQEVDVASGRVLFEWHSLDHIALDESSELGVTMDGNVDYFHLNSVGVDRDGHLLVSARHTSALYKLSRKTGKVIWRLGGTRSDFALGQGISFGYQHDVRRHADGTLTLFDNVASRPTHTGRTSRALRLAIDEKAMTARLVRTYAMADGRAGWAMGNAQQLGDGGLFVGWGMHPTFTDLSARGQVRLDARFVGSGVTYRAYRQRWVGRPTDRPAIARRTTATGRGVVHVSWNGATEVDAWEVRAGSSARDLRRVGRVARRGFETAIGLPANPTHVAVAALDRSGRVLRVTPTASL